MPSAHLPPVSALSDPASPPPILEAFLALLLEPTLVLKVKLVPEVLASTSAVPSLSYEAVLDRAEEVVSGWGWDDKAAFVEGHPRIGENDVLSELSRREQSSTSGPATTQETLDRLRDLNAVYERLFPGLRYITFVNGRSRAQIVPEMEDLLGGDERVRERGSEEWKTECERAVGDVWKIGRKRLDGLMASD